MIQYPPVGVATTIAAMGTLVGIWIFCSIVAMAIGREKGRGLGDSFMYGIVLGPLGVLLVAILDVKPTNDENARQP